MNSNEFVTLMNSMIEKKVTPSFALGTIDPNYVEGNPRIIFDGETTVSTKRYTKLSSYSCEPNDRVLLARMSKTYIVLGSLGDYRGGSGSGGGVGLQFNWNGTKLGVKREDETSYTYVDLGVNDATEKRVKKLESFDFTTKTPKRFAQLKMPHLTVLQSIAVDEVNQNIYATQLTNSSTFPSDTTESFVVSRYSMDGRLLDSMICRHGGHGTNIGVEVSGTTVYIWSHYDVIDAGGNKTDQELVRFPYTAGATFTPSTASIQRFSNMKKGDSLCPAVDNKNGLIAIRYNRGGRQTIDIHNLASVKANNATPIRTITVQDSSANSGMRTDTQYNIYYLQGFCLDGDYVYWHTGDTNSANYPNVITCFDTAQDKIVRQKVINVGKDFATRYESDFREPEGLFLYTDPDTGAKKLLVGIVTGASGARERRIYAYHSFESLMNHTPVIRHELATNTGYNTTPMDRYTPFIQTYILQYSTTTGWGVSTSGNLPSASSAMIDSVTVSGNDLIVNLNERYYGLMFQAFTPDFTLVQAGVGVGSIHFAGGGASNAQTIRFAKAGAQIAPNNASIPNNARISVMFVAMDKKEY